MYRFLAFVLFATAINAEDVNSIIDSMSKNTKLQLESINAHKLENEALVEQNMRHYKEIVDTAKRYYQEFLAKKWGEENVRLSTQKSFTQYSDDMNQRESVDFENGQIVIEIVTELDEELSPEIFTQKLYELMDESMQDAIKKDPVANLTQTYMEKKRVQSPIPPPKEEKLLEDLVDKRAIDKSELKTKEAKLKGNKRKKITYVEIPMVPDHLKKLADRYKDSVVKYAERFGVPPSHIFATIHTESFFNPLALSYVPAYGLMQLVPTTGGRDAYRALSGKDRVLTPKYLYDPDNNIKLGTKYIELIKNSYLEGVEDSEKLYYCTSIAYNAGIGNLYRAIAGKKNRKSEAIERINKMEPDELYELLQTSPRLTHEARQYVKLLKQRRQNYLAYDGI